MMWRLLTETYLESIAGLEMKGLVKEGMIREFKEVKGSYGII